MREPSRALQADGTFGQGASIPLLERGYKRKRRDVGSAALVHYTQASNNKCKMVEAAGVDQPDGIANS